jgi:pimeloyl-ACP methyl ester carboxylesterase
LKTFDVGPCTVAYHDSGRGTGVILAHCSSGSHRMWRPLIAALEPRYRVLAPDLIGYGGSSPWPAAVPFDAELDVELLMRLADLAGNSVHLAAHSYGAAASLEAAKRLEDRVLSLTLIEPVAFHLLREAGREAEWRQVSALADAVWDAASTGSLRAAADTYMTFWIGRTRWWLTPRRQKARIVETVGKVAAEFESLKRARTPLDEYRRIRAPTLLIAGGRTRRPAMAVVEILGELLPAAEVRILHAAGHMSPFTHGDEVRDLIATHVDRHERTYS